ncbi:Xenotropic and polytropic retrovirus receptor 1 [Paramarasmius palmivorus]|uniref:Xenotropic and polytropic retrovirus receptor 1 n=1 Tax=Paramarasmius palmivorus TaxID=297713 RepID=A0AAW0C7R3_9AGAR
MCVDYRGLKKRISSIRKQAGNLIVESPTASTINEEDDAIPIAGPSRSHGKGDASEGTERFDQSRATYAASPVHFDDGTAHDNQELRSERSAGPAERPLFKTQVSTASSISFGKSHSTPRRQKSLLSRRLFSRMNTALHSPHPFSGPLPLNDLYPLLSSEEMKFFKALDHELEKVENFYLDREKDMRARTRLIEEQLNELSQHQQRFHAARARRSRWPVFAGDMFSALRPRFRLLAHRDVTLVGAPTADGLHESDPYPRKISDSKRAGKKRDESPSSFSHWDIGNKRIPERSFNPDEYQNAKKKLKKAVLEHYRRVLNITGFRKALKKFEKVTKIPAQHAYMTEKVETSAFASDKAIRAMMTEMEELYASRFVHGDKKRAVAALRGTSTHKTHHFSTFRTGLLLGLAIPALASGIYESFQEETREAIEGWDGLLLAYGILVVPVVFTLLVGLNLSVWSRSRINYVFIFELDPRTKLDYREYFELPSLLLSTLCYAFWLSFSRIGMPSVAPTIWPLVWLGLAALFVLDPFSLTFKSSRFWLVRIICRLLISGVKRVEFADFWMGDQFCSLVFTLSNLYLFACAYASDFENWRKCGSTNKHWPVAFVLAILPFLVRLVQSIRRYADSKLTTHLINGGKYATGIVYYLFYFLWRHQGGPYNVTFVIWCLMGTIYAVYASVWDFLMDWSLLRPRVQYPLLRSELIYSNHIYMYYVAMITNVLIRFVWVIYIPTGGLDIYLRQFIAAMLEVLRRWQWNFYRLENEHLGNMDQYRVTREVPLPYSLDELDEDEGRED